MKRDRKNKTRVADALDLVNLLAKATNGTLESPAEVLQAIGVAWQAINASNATAARASRADGKGRPSAHASDAPAADLADALLLVQSRWLEEGLLGTVLDEDDFAMHAVHVNHKNVKTALSSMINWSQRNRCDAFLPGVKAIKDAVAAKADGPYRTYAQVVVALRALIRKCDAEIRLERTAGTSDGHEEDDAETFLSDLDRWIWEKWAENGLPSPEAGRERAGPESPAGARRTRRPSVGGKGVKAGEKRSRYEEVDTSDDEDNDDGDDSSSSSDGDDSKDSSDDTSDAREKKRAKSAPDASPSTTEIAPGVILGGPLPHGATISTTTPGAVIVRVKCHGLHATAMVTRPTLPSGATPSFVDAKHAVSVDAPSSPAAHSDASFPASPTPRPAAVMVERWVEGKNERCGRNDGKTWRCKMAAVPGMSFCAHHRQKTCGQSPSPSPAGGTTPAGSRGDLAAFIGGDGNGSGVSIVRYSGPPTSIRVLTVGGVAINDDTVDVLASPAAFEAHAFTISQEAAEMGGPAATRAHPRGRHPAPPPLSPLRLGKDASSSDITAGSASAADDEYFRANALVHEREGAWTPFHLYEVKIMAAAAEAFAKPPPDAPSTATANGASIPGGRGGVVGGVVVGASSGRSDPAADAEAFAAARRLATGPEGAARAAELREQIKATREKMDEVEETISALARDCARYGGAGRAMRETRGRDSRAVEVTEGGEYLRYAETIDRAVALSSKWAAASE